MGGRMLLKAIEKKIKKIHEEIMEKEKQLAEVKGKSCEVYSRVVGYNRDVNHWNKGKKEEFKHRQTFIPKLDRTGDRYIYFFSTHCPNCGPVSKYMEGVKMPGLKINVMNEEGREVAGRYHVMSTPTVIILRGNDVIHRLFNVDDINKILGANNDT
jgi:ribonucleoside-triphosphate reductase